ncbi:ACT domain-containing protein [uncultured Tateyamaria sp.]|uniref:ACT domain-containing protein n=1 Tax=uncultured Tateyamaria sp. TaxID=455651 RepID=UPI002630A31E|nr:ACT domain-containing protein [uncultured Tateyamaria sp.]
MTVKDTQAMIAGMTPIIVPGDWVFCAVNGTDTIPPDAFAVIQEAEGTTLILPEETAKAGGYQSSTVMQLITLQVNSDLEGVGLTAAVATALAKQYIPCNVVAGYHHDHIFVPKTQAGIAYATLLDVQNAAH